MFCRPGALVETVRFYERLTAARLDMDMDIPEGGPSPDDVGGPGPSFQ